jgi:hypothetical protein
MGERVSVNYIELLIEAEIALQPTFPLSVVITFCHSFSLNYVSGHSYPTDLSATALGTEVGEK